MNIAILAAILWSQVASAPAAPKVSDAHKLAFFQAQSAYNEAKAALEKTPEAKAFMAAQSVVQTAADNANEDCGKDFTLNLSKGNLTCEVKKP